MNTTHTWRWLLCALCAALTLLTACAEDDTTSGADTSSTSDATTQDTSGSTSGTSGTDASTTSDATIQDTSGTATTEDTTDQDTATGEDTTDQDTSVSEDTTDQDTATGEDTTDQDTATAEDTSEDTSDTGGGELPVVQSDCGEAELDSCFTNYDCGDASRCQDIGATDPVACCVPAARGEGAAGDPCTDENDCRSGICIDPLDGNPALCSDRCGESTLCPENMSTCDIIPFVSADENDTWCQW